MVGSCFCKEAALFFDCSFAFDRMESKANWFSFLDRRITQTKVFLRRRLTGKDG